MSFKKRVSESVHGPSDVQIGKQGLTEGVISEIKSRLDKKGVVKVRILKSALVSTGLTRQELAKMVSEAVGARLLDVRGRTFILYKPRSMSAERR
ncbi:MAG: YhbY family RNA-binding protein [Acidilobaceae archaeon]